MTDTPQPPPSPQTLAGATSTVLTHENPQNQATGAQGGRSEAHLKPKRAMFLIQGSIVFLMSVGYVGMTAYSLWKWNEATSGALITGFVLFAQHSIDRYFDLVKYSVCSPNQAEQKENAK